MSRDPASTPARRIDRMCDAFEAAWRVGARPALEGFLVAAAESERAELLRELLALEIEFRRGLGEWPTTDDYLPRFPDRIDIIQSLFAMQTLASAPGDAAATVTLTVLEGPQQGRAFTLAGHETFLFGRSKQCHFQLPADDKRVSRLHFMIEANPPSCRLTDLVSHNGTHVNGMQIDEKTDLRDGDRIKAGHTVFGVAVQASGDEVVDLKEVGAITVSFNAKTAPAEGTADSPKGGMSAPEVEGYDIVREIGRGGMGVVYEAVWRADGSRVALKTVVPAVAASKSQVERFLREARILCQLDHRNIVSFRAMAESGKLLCFAMDYIDGKDAAQMLKELGPLPVRTAVRMICQLLSALEYAHGKGFVHRDIKPGNLLVSQEGAKKVVKLADFGLARVYHASKLSGLTLQGDVGGTYAFMPPEQVTNFRDVKPAADQYSAAATLYTLLTGRYVYNFKKESTTPVALILLEDPVAIEQRRSDLPAKLAQIIHRALAREPEKRFTNVCSFRTALLAFSR